MKYSELKKYKELLYLDKSVIKTIYPSKSVLDINNRLSRLIKDEKLIRLKRDMYILSEEYDKLKIYPEYLSVLACTIRYPSYITGTTILRRYDVLAEATYGYDLVTTKKRSLVVNKAGSFSYKEISKNLFTGYEIKYFLAFEYYEATKAKALFDWIYYRVNIIPHQIDGINLVEELRLNLSSYEKSDLEELLGYVKYAKNKDVLSKIILNIIKYAYTY